MNKDSLLQLRKLHGHLHEWWQRKKRDIALIIEFARKRDSLIIIGSPEHTNLGDSAILLSQIKFLESIYNSDKDIKEITYSEFYEHRSVLKRIIRQEQLILGLGGGNMGNQWPREERIRYDIMADYPHNAFVVFPQTLYFLDNSEKQIANSVLHYCQHKELTLVAREECSFRLMKELYKDKNVLLTPDIVLFSRMQDYGVTPQERSGVLFCARSDPEKAVAESVWTELERLFADKGVEVRHTDMYSDCEVTKKNRLKCVRSKMQQFCCAQMVITDRLHGMIFAALTGTPCIVFSNYNHKVKGTYEWISYLSYIRYAETPEEAKAAIPDLLMMTNCHFDNTPLMPYFEELSNVVKVKCLK